VEDSNDVPRSPERLSRGAGPLYRVSLHERHHELGSQCRQGSSRTVRALPSRSYRQLSHESSGDPPCVWRKAPGDRRIRLPWLPDRLCREESRRMGGTGATVERRRLPRRLHPSWRSDRASRHPTSAVAPGVLAGRRVTRGPSVFTNPRGGGRRRAQAERRARTCAGRWRSTRGAIACD
jgi:hypothetical protein